MKDVDYSDIAQIVAESRRRRQLKTDADYTPERGNPADPARTCVGGVFLPRTMLEDPEYSPALPRFEMEKLRFRHDFEYWCVRCVHIIHKATKQVVPFRLNAPQRRMLAVLERQRLAGQPLRLIVLKARQWGGSTLVQIYFAWIQLIHRSNWNSFICSHLKDSASNIRAMYSCLLDHYPQEFWEDGKPEFKPFERMANTRFIPGRGCRVTVCSAENQEATRGQDCAMAHLSEVAFWRDSDRHSPLDLIRSVSSGIMLTPLTAVVLESTANGVGNYFHREWLRAVSGQSDKEPFFVPWYEIDLYTAPVPDPEALWNSLDGYERELFRHCPEVTLEGIAWYHARRREYEDHRSMQAEFPSSPDEAFTNTGHNVFSSQAVEELRKGCATAPETGFVKGSPDGPVTDISAPSFTPHPHGDTEVWQRPRPGASYMAVVDIGGRSAGADYSVIAVFDTHSDSASPDALPEVVAQWRGHTDHDLLAWRAAALAAYYNTATLVFESNTLECTPDGHGQFLLQTLAGAYPELYHRPPAVPGGQSRPGFHTNRATKNSMLDRLIMLVREGRYIERSHIACDELLQYEHLPDGSYAARKGCHDDVLMTRAIALYLLRDYTPPTPFVYVPRFIPKMGWW